MQSHVVFYFKQIKLRGAGPGLFFLLIEKKMITKLLAQKLRMEQKFDQEGNFIPLTVLKAPRGVVFQIKNNETDGYSAIQVGVGEKKEAGKSLEGRIKKAGIEKSPAFFYECSIDEKEVSDYKLGQEITPTLVLQLGDRVNARGSSKGRGFSGAIKRWGFQSQPKTHGQSDRERAPGSIGAQTPGRVFKGKKMPGHFGNTKITVKNLPVYKIDDDNQEIWVKGSVPGAIKSWVLLTKTSLKNKKVTPLENPSGEANNDK